MKSNTIDNSSLFLVSGGGKGITAQCVIELAQRRQCGFLLVGRSEYSSGPEPSWAEGASEKRALNRQAMEYLKAQEEEATPKRVKALVNDLLSRREIGNTLRAIEEAGGRAAYLSADVTNLSDLKAGLEKIFQEWDGEAKITGLIHGAGVLADKPIQNKTRDDFGLVYAVKVDGLRNLLACLNPEDLEHMVLFSSVAAFYGNVGQADYAMANEVLNKFAHQFQRDHPACRVLAINWGAWNGGMVTPALKRVLTHRGIDLIPSEIGTKIFADTLTGQDREKSPVQLVVGPPLTAPAQAPDEELRTRRVHRRLSLQANPFLRDHVIGGKAVLPTVAAIAWAGNTAEQFYPGYTFYQVEEYKALKGIVFDETLAEEHLLELRETAKSEEEILLDALIQSQTKDGKPRYHYKMALSLRRELPEPPLFEDFELSESALISGERLYKEKILFHGPSFQGVDEVLAMNDQGLTLLCEIPRVSWESQGQFPIQSFNPFAADTTLQSLLVWAYEQYGYGGLPLRIQKGTLFQPLPAGNRVYATLEVQERSASKLVADVTVHDARGQVYSKTTGAEITLSKRLNQLFAQNRL